MFSPSFAIFVFTNSPTVVFWSFAKLLLVERLVLFEVRPLGLGHFFQPDKLRLGLRNMRRDIRRQNLKILRARHEVGLAIHFHQHAQTWRRR